MLDEKVLKLVENAKKTGAACVSVDDGHVIVLTKDKLRTLLETDSESNIVVIFVKKSDPNLN